MIMRSYKIDTHYSILLSLLLISAQSEVGGDMSDVKVVRCASRPRNLKGGIRSFF